MDLLLECESVESLVEFSLMNSLTLIFVEWAVEDFNEIRYLRSELHDLACRKRQRHFQSAAVIFSTLEFYLAIFDVATVDQVHSDLRRKNFVADALLHRSVHRMPISGR